MLKLITVLVICAMSFTAQAKGKHIDKANDDAPTQVVMFVAMAESAGMFCDGAVFNQQVAGAALSLAGSMLGHDKRDELSVKYTAVMNAGVISNRTLFCANAREISTAVDSKVLTFNDE